MKKSILEAALTLIIRQQRNVALEPAQSYQGSYELHETSRITVKYIG
jgi:hypothetical protein